MTALEEIKTSARQILARHGMADHKAAVKIYKERGINPHDNTIKAICEYFVVDIKDLLSARRDHPYSHIRQILCHLLYHESGLNHTAISKLINRDRSTVIYSLNAIGGYLRYDNELRQEIDFLTGIVNDYGGEVQNDGE